MLDNCFHGLNRDKCRILALDYANANDINTPANWNRDDMAGIEWFSNFMDRNKLSIRKPEATSLARQTAFNKVVVGKFYEKLSDIMARYHFNPQDIYNLDETGITTVQAPGNVVTATGKKQVGSTSSQERGELVTMCCAINASGNHIPPFYIFPRVFMKESFMNGCAPGAKGVASKTGYMNSELFSNEYLPFFISSVRCSKENPVLLILDNHCSHVSLSAIELCKASGIHLLTLPPHTSHKLQPLDRCVYGPLKTYLNQAMDNWMRSNPGRSVSIYEMASLSSTPFSKSMGPENISSAFRCTGIYPLNSMVFGDHEFISASVTDQPPPPTLAAALPTEPMETNSSPSTSQAPGESMPSTSQAPGESMPSTSQAPGESMPSTSQAPGESMPSTSQAPGESMPSTSQAPGESMPSSSCVSTEPLPSINRVISQSDPSMRRVSPQQLLPLPKASTRKPINRRKLTSAIYPRKGKIGEGDSRQTQQETKKTKSQLSTQKQQDSSTEEEELPKGVLASDTDSPEEMDETEHEMATTDVKPGVYVLVKFVTKKKSSKFYIGEVKSEVGGSYEVRFMRKVKESAASFVFPDKDDINWISFGDIILVLGYPITLLGTKRAASKVMFRVDISGFPVE